MELNKVELADNPNAVHALKSVNGIMSRTGPKYYADQMTLEDGTITTSPDKLPYFFSVSQLDNAIFKDENNILYAPVKVLFKKATERYSSNLTASVFIKDIGKPSATFILRDLHTILRKEAIEEQYIYPGSRYVFNFLNFNTTMVREMMEICRKGNGTIIDYTWLAIFMDVLEKAEERAKLVNKGLKKAIIKSSVKKLNYGTLGQVSSKKSKPVVVPGTTTIVDISTPNGILAYEAAVKSIIHGAPTPNKATPAPPQEW